MCFILLRVVEDERRHGGNSIVLGTVHHGNEFADRQRLLAAMRSTVEVNLDKQEPRDSNTSTLWFS